MSGISFPYVFGCSVDHDIACMCITTDNICTGSSSGEIAIWKRNIKWEVGVICSLPEDSGCIDLANILACYEVQRLLDVKHILISLHCKSKIRAWDLVDGKCLSYSSNLFSEDAKLEFIAESNTKQDVIVAGKTEVFLLDIYKMEKIKYFCIHNAIVKIYVFFEKLIISDHNTIYKLNLLSTERDPVVYYKHKDISEVLALDIDILVLLEYDYIVFVCLSETHYNLNSFKTARIKFDECVLSASIEKDKIGLLLHSHMLLYTKSDIINNPKHPASPLVIQLKFHPRVYKIHNDAIITTDGKDLVVYDINTPKVESCNFFLPDNEFNFLTLGEKVTARNIFVSSEILYGIGTSTGRVILLTVSNNNRLFYYQEASEVTCLYLHKHTLVVGYFNQNLSFWNFKIQKGSAYHTLPDKTIEVRASYVQVMIPIVHTKRNIDFFNVMSWKNSKLGWENTILGQCETGNVLLISLDTREILCYFQALRSNIIKATMYLNLEYLALSCSNGNLYIFNMSIQAIEREVIGDAVLGFDDTNISDVSANSLNKSHKIDCFFEFYFMEKNKKCVEASFIFTGKKYLPCLDINTSLIRKSSKKYPKNVINDIGVLISSNIFKQGVYGVNRTVSFKCEWVKSNYCNTLRIGSLLSMEMHPAPLPLHTVTVIIYCLKSNPSIRNKLFKYLDIGPEIAELATKILKSAGPQRKNLYVSNNSLHLQKYHSERTYVSLVEALSITIISFTTMSLGLLSEPKLIELIIKMIKTAELGYVLTACEIINKGMHIFKDYLKDTQIEDIIKELLLYSCKKVDGIGPDFFYKVISSVGLNDLEKFIGLLMSEIKRSEMGSHYISAVLYTVEFFIMHYYLEATSALDSFGDFLISANNLKISVNAREFDSDFKALVQTFACLLPMTSVTPSSRYMAVGLPTGDLNLYDFKSGKKSKTLNVFNTTVSAIAAADSFIACYSLHQSLVAVIKIDSKIFGNADTLKLQEKVFLEEIEPQTESYQEMIKIVKIRWEGKNELSLTRENKKEYKILLKKNY
jgi:hypothetical protein